MPTRLNDPAKSAIIVIMQRLHGNDVSGTILKLGLPYVHLMLPMEFEPERRCVTHLGRRKKFTDPRTYEGELIFPERYPREIVEEMKVPLGSYGVAGQFQQRPTPREGGLFKAGWLTKRLRAMPASAKRCRAWDFAATEKKAADAKKSSDPDATASVLLGKDVEGRFVFQHAEQLWELGAAVKKTVKARAQADGKTVKIRIPQDPGQAGKAQAQAYLRDLAGWVVRAIPPTGDKETRAMPLAAQAEAGNIYFVETGDPEKDAWIEPFIGQLASFPGGSHDDLVDAAADAFNELAEVQPGEGLIDWYRREVEEQREAAEALGRHALPDDLVGLQPPEGVSTAYGLDGSRYQLAPDGLIYMPEDAAKALASAPGWSRPAPLELDEDERPE